MKLHVLKGKSFWVVAPGANCSWCWRKILKLRSIVMSMIAFEIENGESIFIWHDYWHPKGPLLLAYGVDWLTGLAFRDASGC